MLTSCLVKVLLKLTKTKELGPEWKYLVVLEEKDKGSPKVQYFKNSFAF